MNTKKSDNSANFVDWINDFWSFFWSREFNIPCFLGQQAQANYPQAFLGFILSDCGFILIGIASLCLSQTYHFKKN